MSTLIVVAGGASRVTYGMNTLGGGAEVSFCYVSVVYGSIDLGGMVMLNVDDSCFNTAVCLSPIFVSEIVGVGLRRVWVRSTAVCISECAENLLISLVLMRRTLFFLLFSILLSW